MSLPPIIPLIHLAEVRAVLWRISLLPRSEHWARFLSPDLALALASSALRTTYSNRLS